MLYRTYKEFQTLATESQSTPSCKCDNMHKKTEYFSIDLFTIVVFCDIMQMFGGDNNENAGCSNSG